MTSTYAKKERMLTDGFYAEVTLAYDGIIAQEKGGRPFKVDGLRPDPDVEIRRLGRLRQGPSEIQHHGMDRLPDAVDRSRSVRLHREGEARRAAPHDSLCRTGTTISSNLARAERARATSSNRSRHTLT